MGLKNNSRVMYVGDNPTNDIAPPNKTRHAHRLVHPRRPRPRNRHQTPPHRPRLHRAAGHPDQRVRHPPPLANRSRVSVRPGMDLPNGKMRCRVSWSDRLPKVEKVVAPQTRGEADSTGAGDCSISSTMRLRLRCTIAIPRPRPRIATATPAALGFPISSSHAPSKRASRPQRRPRRLPPSLQFPGPIQAEAPPSWRGAPATQVAGWDIFTSPFMGTNQPDLPLTTAPGAGLVQTLPGGLITSTGNLYHPAGPSAFVISDSTSADLLEVVLQLSTQGSPLATQSPILSFGPLGSPTLLPFDGYELLRNQGGRQRAQVHLEALRPGSGHPRLPGSIPSVAPPTWP